MPFPLIHAKSICYCGTYCHLGCRILEYLKKSNSLNRFAKNERLDLACSWLLFSSLGRTWSKSDHTIRMD